VISQIWEATRAQQMKIDPPTVTTELWPTKYTLQRCIDYIEIIRPSSAMGLQSEYMGENDDFSTALHENT